MNPVIKAVTEEEAKSLTITVVNEALKTVIGNDLNYEDVIKITKDSESNVTSIQTDSLRINAIARDTTLLTQSRLKTIGEQGIHIPLGSLSGIVYFGGKGPNVTIDFLPIGTVSIEFKSDLKSVGINNTLHSIQMLVHSKVTAIVPGLNPTFNVTATVPFAETVIIGKIPQFYFNSNALDNMLNLIP